MTAVLLALGSNLGDRAGNLRAAIRLLGERGVEVLGVSSAWETAPVPADQPPFLNAALRGETELASQELLEAMKGIEHELGRRPSSRWGPRPIDLDILLYGDERISTPTLTVPHERVAERAFVLAPLAEVWRGPLPVVGKSAVELLEDVDRAGLRRTGESLLPPAV